MNQEQLNQKTSPHELDDELLENVTGGISRAEPTKATQSRTDSGGGQSTSQTEK